MTQVLPGVGAEGAAAGVAGAQFSPGGEGVGAVGVAGADDVLPFTGSVFTLPIALLGAALTAGGWFLTRFSIERT
jgi:hypothetical protein